MENLEFPPSLLNHLPWDQTANPIWPATVFTLRRNLAKYNFPHKLEKHQLDQTLTLLKEALLKEELLSQAHLFPAEQLSPLDKEFLFEHFLCQKGFQNTFQGQAFLVDSSHTLLSYFNIENHLQLHLLDCRGEWEKSWNRLATIETNASKVLDFAFSSRFGYLTADPACCGTALTIHLFLHIPAIIHTGQLEESINQCLEEEIDAAGMQGTGNELIGDLLVLSNRYTLGVSEENIFNSLQNVSTKMQIAEKSLRTHLKEQNNSEIKDYISKAFGLIMHAYQLPTTEALDNLSLLKLGTDLGWVKGITDIQLNALFFKCQKAHLALSIGQKRNDPQDFLRDRALFLQQQLKTVELAI